MEHQRTVSLRGLLAGEAATFRGKTTGDAHVQWRCARVQSYTPCLRVRLDMTGGRTGRRHRTEALRGSPVGGGAPHNQAVGEELETASRLTVDAMANMAP